MFANHKVLSRIRSILSVCLLMAVSVNGAPSVAQGTEDQNRLRAIAEFTEKMKAANFPALFDKAANEFGVPPDVLKAISFAETRWTQVEWPPGEMVSPDTGLPRPFGIMSLWDNDYFGHTLQQAAQLIGQTPEMLRTNAFQNMRGGAALLRQLYNAAPKPADATDTNQIESWRYAIAKYTGIPQPELSHAHALRVYEYMNQGYHQYGIEWDRHPVNLPPMRAEVAKIKASRRLKSLDSPAEMKTNLFPNQEISGTNVTVQMNPMANTAPHEVMDFSVRNQHQRWLLLGLMAGLIIIAMVYLFKNRNRAGERNK